MTVAAVSSRIRYTGNGVTTDFPILFSFGQYSEIKAIEITTLGVEVPWVLDGAGATGFTVASSTLTAIILWLYVVLLLFDRLRRRSPLL